jgi:uncharacterized membrane protein YgdD (TMEM256/DUF423 family)
MTILGAITPFGGVMLIMSWLLLGLGVALDKRHDPAERG